jgi:signal transduction histidine kinase
MSYLREAIDYQENNKLEDGLCTSYLTLGNVYLKMKDTSNAILSYQKSIFFSKKTGNKIALASAYVNLGSIKSQQNKSKEAISLFNTSKQIRDSINIRNEESILSLNLVKEKLRVSDFKSAKQDLLKLKNIYEPDTKEVENLTETYQLLIQTYAYLQRPDSVSYYMDQESKLKNEIIETAVVKQTNELEAKYQTAKKEKLLLQKEIEAKHKNLLITGISLVACLIAFIAFLIYRQQKTKNYQQNQEYQLKIAISKIETQNELQKQRLAISRDLHDNIGAELTFIISAIDNINYAFDIADPKLKHRLSKISAFASDTIIELRDTIWAMNHSEITFEDLQSRISNFMEKAKETKVQTNFLFAINESLKHTKLSSVHGMNIYRTIQEAVNNSIKYARATEISVDAKRIDSQIVINIKDNGVGFDIAATEKGNGLLNMQKRMESIDGSFELTSIPDEGTSISLIINRLTT